jgi:hypothetical protein
MSNINKVINKDNDKISLKELMKLKKLQLKSSEELLNQSVDEVKLDKFVSKLTSIKQPCHITEEVVPKFESDDPKLVTYLKENGYAVIKNVANQQEINDSIDLLWKFLESNTLLRRHDPSTWTDLNFNKIGTSSSGTIGGEGIQQSEFLWKLRLLPKGISI